MMNRFFTLVTVFVISCLIFMPVQAKQREFTSTQIERLAGIAVGESHSDPYSVACVMRNRLDGGWAPQLVHHAFYAKWSAPSNEQFEKLQKILKGEGDCNKDAWYQFATSAISYIGPKSESFLFESGGNSFYSKEALK